jgi:uncharacterized protein (TIGR03089 family)
MVDLSVPRPPGGVPADVPALLRALLDDDSGRPRLTWYGPSGERIELSARVLDNWVAKTANLLVEELDAGPGAVVALALPPHWRTAVWLLAVWSTGACATVASPAEPVPEDADVVVSADVEPLTRACDLGRRTVAVALPALSASFGPDVPEDAVDYSLEVAGFGDVFVPFVTPTPQDAALRLPDRPPLNHGELTAAASSAADAAGLPPRARLLTGAGAEDAVPALLAPLVRFGSVVLHHDLPTLTADQQALARLRAQERVTAPPQ